ncbi:MAG TPA: hypothetical protein VHE14_02880 [Solirubrobacteraceae bacterium]|nr:hypothetical protein [Solirubrobacteraceae bacterium]
MLALVLALAGLSACGSSGGGANKLLKQTFAKHSKKVTSGKLSVAVDISAGGVRNLSKPVSIKLTGPFQSQGAKQIPKFDFALAFSGGGQSLSAGAVSTGDKAYLKFQGTPYEVPANIFAQFKQGFGQAQSKNTQKNQPTLKSLGLDPLRWLKNPKVLGDSNVGGAATKHVSASIDVPKFLDDVNKLLGKAGSLGGLPGSSRVPQRITPQQRSKIQQQIKQANFDVYTGKDDKLLRKLNINLKVAQKGQSGNVVISLEIDNLNESQTITAPANAQPFSQLASKLGGLGTALGGGAAGGGAGGGAGSGGGAGGGAGAGGSGSSAKAQKYADCITAAQNDVAKAQKCIKLLK